MNINRLSPSYLYEIFESESDDDEEVSTEPEKKVTRCFLCGELKDCPCELSEEMEDSEYSFSDVLAKLFSREDLPIRLARRDTTRGLLCIYCKYLVMDLFRLQKELKTVKNVIMRTYKNSEERTDFDDEQYLFSKNNAEKSGSCEIVIIKDTKNNCVHERKHRKRQKADEVHNGDAKLLKSSERNNGKNDIDVKVKSHSDKKTSVGEFDIRYDDHRNTERNQRYNKTETELDKPVEKIDTDDDDDDDGADKDEAVYNIEALVAKKDGEYLVKWENYPEEENTWEPAWCIPDSILEYYQKDRARMGHPLPPDFTRFEYDASEDEDDDIWEPEESDKVNTGKEKERPLKKREQKQNRRGKKLKLEDFKPKPQKGKTIERLIAKNGLKYLVKWTNLSDDENTWEPKSAIPKYILTYYESDLSLLGTAPPSLETGLYRRQEQDITQNSPRQVVTHDSPGGTRRKLFTEPAGPQLLT